MWKNASLKSVFFLLIVVALQACQSRPVAVKEEERAPAAERRSPWVEFDYNHPEKSDLFRDVVWREEELTERSRLMDRCNLTADWNKLEPIEQELLFIRLNSWPRAKVSAAVPWLDERALSCLLQAPST